MTFRPRQMKTTKGLQRYAKASKILMEMRLDNREKRLLKEALETVGYSRNQLLPASLPKLREWGHDAGIKVDLSGNNWRIG